MKKTYIKPEIEAIDIITESSILCASAISYTGISDDPLADGQEWD